MTDELTPEETKEILEALNAALDKGPWKKSIFLRAIGKKLEGVREEFKSGLVDETALIANQELAKEVKPKSDKTMIFISLYNAQGKQIERWEQLIGALLLQTLTRPTYRQERDIQEAISITGSAEAQGYVSVEVKETDILTIPEGKAPKDRRGVKLLSLRKNALKPENIQRFYHSSGVYAFEAGKLIKQ